MERVERFPSIPNGSAYRAYLRGYGRRNSAEFCGVCGLFVGAVGIRRRDYYCFIIVLLLGCIVALLIFMICYMIFSFLYIFLSFPSCLYFQRVFSNVFFVFFFTLNIISEA